MLWRLSGSNGICDKLDWPSPLPWLRLFPCPNVVKDGVRLPGDYDRPSVLESSPDGRQIVFAGVRDRKVERVVLSW